MSEVFKQRPVFKGLHNLLQIPLPVNHPVDFNDAAPDKVKNKIGLYGKGIRGDITPN